MMERPQPHPTVHPYPQMYPQVVCGIDPGLSTGMAFAVLRSAPNEPPHYKYDSMTLTEHKHVWSMVRPPVSVVVIEQFGAQTISKYGLHTVEIVGGVMALCDMLSIGVARDAPQQRRPYMDLARTLVPNGETHRMRHEVDAMSHVLFWLYHNVPGVVEL